MNGTLDLYPAAFQSFCHIRSIFVGRFQRQHLDRPFSRFFRSVTSQVLFLNLQTLSLSVYPYLTLSQKPFSLSFSLALVFSILPISPFSRKTHKSCKRWLIPKLSVVEQLAQLIVAAATAAAAEESSKLVELFFTFFLAAAAAAAEAEAAYSSFFLLFLDRWRPSRKFSINIRSLKIEPPQFLFLKRKVFKTGGGGPVLEGN